MTEIGMAISNPYVGNAKPVMWFAAPGVEIRLVDEQQQEVATGQPGEIQVKGANVFREYWNKPRPQKRITKDGWFRDWRCSGGGSGLLPDHGPQFS